MPLTRGTDISVLAFEPEDSTIVQYRTVLQYYKLGQKCG